MKGEWLERMYRWFSPHNGSCPVCGRDRRDGAPPLPVPIRHAAARQALSSLCGDCVRAIPWIDIAACSICGRPERCGDCLRRSVRHFQCCRAAVRYDAAMRDWLALYKYRGLERLEPVLAAMLALPAERLLSRVSAFAVAAVPLADERLRERGFNQAERMALRIARWYRIPYLPLLRRVRHTDKQSFKGRGDRLENMRGSFAAAGPVALPDDGKERNIILVDDIYTTGSTINECAYVIRKAYPSCKIYGLLWARS